MSNFYDVVLEVLKQDERFFSEDGVLLRNAVYEAAMQMDSALIKNLFENEVTKDRFFTIVDGIAVFDKVGFGWVINNRQFLPDSYTRYKNKIGLVDSKGDYIANSNDVELVFPYKDCVLEGGQTKEDQKRSEIFYNETLAPDEVDRLLYPKVLTNAVRYTADGQEKATEFKEDDNLIVKGNNLFTISSLLKKYEGKIKLIYLDPPYNTGNDGFGYNDNFSYSSWLSFMKTRLELSRKLLAKDGLIFISIDVSRNNANGRVGTTAFPYLTVLIDEIFGRKNYISTLMWKKKKQPSFLSRVAGILEPILVYAKDESQIKKLQLGTQSDKTKRVDNASNKNSTMHIMSGVRYMGAEKDCIIKKGKYQNKTMSTEFLQDVIIRNGRTTNEFDAIAKFRNGQEEITKFCENDLLYITASNSFRRYKSKEEESAGKTITDLLLDWGQNQDATDELRKLFNITNDSKIFDNPKPELLLNNIISVATDNGDIVLDFFLGSGTTAAVAHKLGRQYIGIEQMDYIETVAVERLKKVINGEQGGVSKSAYWQGGGSFVYCELAKLNQKYVDEIQNANTDEQLASIFSEVLKTGFISCKINPKDIDTESEDFKSLSIEDKKRLIMELLDKNQLYVNYCDIDDEDFEISEEDKAFTKSFYGEK